MANQRFMVVEHFKDAPAIYANSIRILIHPTAFSEGSGL